MYLARLQKHLRGQWMCATRSLTRWSAHVSQGKLSLGKTPAKEKLRKRDLQLWAMSV